MPRPLSKYAAGPRGNACVIAGHIYPCGPEAFKKMGLKKN
jgi:hypothetical protein